MKNPITLENGVISATSPLEIPRFIVYTIAYLIFGPMRYAISRSSAGWEQILLVFLTFLWLYLISGLRSTTWFIPSAGSIRRRNLLFYTRDIALDEIAAVNKVESSGPFMSEGTVHFVLVKKRNPLAKGYRITGNISPSGPEYSFFVSEALPAINMFLFGNAEGPSPNQAEREAMEKAAAGFPPERVRHFKKAGNTYFRRHLPIMMVMAPVGIFMLIAAGNMLLSGEADSEALVLVVMGLAATLAPALETLRVGIDLDQGDLVLTKWYGLRRERIPVTPDVQAIPQRNYGNFMFLGTTLMLCYPGSEGKIEKHSLGSSHFFRRGFLELERETKLLLEAACAKRKTGESKTALHGISKISHSMDS